MLLINNLFLLENPQHISFNQLELFLCTCHKFPATFHRNKSSEMKKFHRKSSKNPKHHISLFSVKSRISSQSQYHSDLYLFLNLVYRKKNNSTSLSLSQQREREKNRQVNVSQDEKQEINVAWRNIDLLCCALNDEEYKNVKNTRRGL